MMTGPKRSSSASVHVLYAIPLDVNASIRLERRLVGICGGDRYGWGGGPLFHTCLAVGRYHVAVETRVYSA